MATYRAIWNDVVIAESDSTVVVDGYRYFPEASVHHEFLVPSSHHSVCGWKGRASYFDVSVGGEVNRNAAWHYPAPMPGAWVVNGCIGFWRGVRIEEIGRASERTSASQ